MPYKDLRSLEWGRPRTISITNNRADEVSLYWIDYFGVLVFYATIPEQETYVQSTYATHPWVIATADGDIVGIHVPFEADSKIIIR